MLAYIVYHFPALSSLKTDTALKTEYKDGQLLIVAATQERLIELALNPHYKGPSFAIAVVLLFIFLVDLYYRNKRRVTNLCSAEADFWSMFLLTYSYFASSLELFTHIRTAYERLIASPSPWTSLWRKQYRAYIYHCVLIDSLH